MSAVPFRPAQPFYDVDETAHAFQVRQRAAYLAGKTTWREGLISAQALQLYDELVRYVGANRFCWVKEETLAGLLRRSVSTIKRWMQQLVDAHLIRRGRRFGQSSLTSITTYDTGSNDQEADQDVAGPASAEAFPTAQLENGGTDSVGHADESAGRASPACPDAQPSPATTDGFFSSTDEPSMSSWLRPHTLSKPTNLIGGSLCGPTARITPPIETDTTRRLEDEGILDPRVLQELHDRPLGQIETVIRYVARCRRPDDPRRPGLIVYLIRLGFGLRRRGAPRVTSTTEAIRPVTMSNAAPPGEVQTSSPDRQLTSTWQAVLRELRTQLDEQEYATWVHPNACLLLEDELAVIGTPNVFVRDVVDQRYRGVIETALSHQLERAVAIELVIGTNCGLAVSVSAAAPACSP